MPLPAIAGATGESKESGYRCGSSPAPSGALRVTAGWQGATRRWWRAAGEPASLTNSLLRNRQGTRLPRYARSGCSTYCTVRLRARTVARLV